MANEEPGVITTALACQLLGLTRQQIDRLVDGGYTKRHAPGKFRSVELVQGYIRFLRDEREIASHAALAELFGVSKRTISDLALRGIIVRSERGYALAASVKGYCDHLRTLATGRGGDEKAIATATAERARLAKAQAEFVETKNAVARRELVSAAEVENEWSGILRTVRAAMLAVPSRCAQRLPGLNAHDVSEIDREVREVLTEVGTG